MEPIPFIDIRNANPAKLLELHPERATKLIRASRNAFGLASRIGSYAALPIGDYYSRNWLDKTRNPYQNEIEQYAAMLKTNGIFALNLCYEWGCTSGAYAHDESMALIRVLDWPFPALGETMVVAHQSGSAGDFYNITWPGLAGSFNGMAPGRFSAALNQAPMRRHGGNMVIDWIRNRKLTHRAEGLPPAHLLRLAFETAENYAQAKDMLCNHPVSIPVIYILAGTNSTEGCIIERLENSYAVRELSEGKAFATNHFESTLNEQGRGWTAREYDSHGRYRAANALAPATISDDFAWFQFPIGNSLSRLAFIADAGKGTLHLIGTDGQTPVTQMFHLG